MSVTSDVGFQYASQVHEIKSQDFEPPFLSTFGGDRA